MTPALRDQVRQRAGDRCEYCHLAQECTILPHEADHIRSQKHRGQTTLDNVALACFPCNDFKGSDVAAFDPVTNRLVLLFNPRTDTWADHFEWNEVVLVGKTEVARATIQLLQINVDDRLEHRRLLALAGIDWRPKNQQSP
jgi:5-methylcytosine-specific restriction endonuclease McrA